MSQQLKRLAVFGGSGQTGRVLCKQALERNYALSILARNPELLPSEIRDHPNVNILKGDVTNADDVFRTIVNGATEEEQAAGVKRGTAHAVLSCLGTQILRGPPAKCHSLGVRNMISAMKSGSTACNKLVVMSAVGVGESAKDVPFWARPASYLANQFILKEVQEDKAIMEKEIFESGLDYTIIRPPGLTNGALTKNYTFGPNLFGMLVSRADVADLMLRAAQGELPKQAVTIKYW